MSKDIQVKGVPMIMIRVEYGGGTVDEYPIEWGVAHKLFDHFWRNPNVHSVSFTRISEEVP